MAGHCDLLQRVEEVKKELGDLCKLIQGFDATPSNLKEKKSLSQAIGKYSRSVNTLLFEHGLDNDITTAFIMKENELKWCVENLTNLMKECFDEKLQNFSNDMNDFIIEGPDIIEGSDIDDMLLQVIQLLDFMFPNAGSAFVAQGETKIGSQKAISALDVLDPITCHNLIKSLLKVMHDEQLPSRTSSRKLDQTHIDTVIGIIVMNFQHCLGKKHFEDSIEAVATFADFYDCIAVETKKVVEMQKQLNREIACWGTPSHPAHAFSVQQCRAALANLHVNVLSILDEEGHRGELWTHVRHYMNEEGRAPYVNGLFWSLEILSTTNYVAYKDLAADMLFNLGCLCFSYEEHKGALVVPRYKTSMDVFLEAGVPRTFYLWRMLANARRLESPYPGGSSFCHNASKSHHRCKRKAMLFGQCEKLLGD